jgi:hypothetical protein
MDDARLMRSTVPKLCPTLHHSSVSDCLRHTAGLSQLIANTRKRERCWRPEKVLKSAGPQGLWGFKSPSGHQQCFPDALCPHLSPFGSRNRWDSNPAHSR